MVNKIADNCVTIENRSIASTIKSLSSKILTLKTGSFHKNAYRNKRKAFSVAEAFIVLLIGSIALGMSAPMITKQIKAQNMADAQLELLKRTIMPRGAIMFFDLDDCPDGWAPLDSKYNGRYFKVAGDYTICDKDGENSDGTCKGSAVTTVTDNNIGVFSGDAIRNIIGEFTAYEMGRFGVADIATGPFSVAINDEIRGASSHSGRAPMFTFDASRVVPTADENRPRSVSMLACRRN